MKIAYTIMVLAAVSVARAKLDKNDGCRKSCKYDPVCASKSCKS